MKILVCDDIKRRAARTAQQIKAATGHDVEFLAAQRLTTAIEALMERAGAVLRDPGGALATTATSAFDDGFDVAILDNNLSELELAGARHTAESIAGYMRAFVNVPYLVSLNKNPHVDFDLRYLMGDHETHTDLVLNSDHLANSALWTGKPAAATDSWLPWYWPVLNDAPERRRTQIHFVSEHLDAPILKSLGFERPAAADGLSRHAKGALSPDAPNVTTITFQRFFEKTCRSLPIPDHRQKLSKAAPEGDTARDVVSQVVAAELERWVRRELMGPQELVVDVPHLLARMPFLLGADANDVECWNEAVRAPDPPYGLDQELYAAHVATARFPYDAWTQSPCFWWRRLKGNAQLSQMFFEKSAPWAEAVFCEDISRFRLVAQGSSGGPREFAAEFEGAWNRRHVAYLKGKRYRPQSRLVK